MFTTEIVYFSAYAILISGVSVTILLSRYARDKEVSFDGQASA